MSWIAFLLLGYLMLGLQIALRAYLSYGGVAPNLVLLAVVFIAINAERESALLGCFLLGACQDLLTQQPLGLYAFSYGAVGLLLASGQKLVYRGHPLTHFSLALVASLACGLVMLLHAAVYHILHGADGFSRATIWNLCAGALYTAILAPLVILPLQKMKGLFGFRAPNPYTARN